MPQTNSGIHVVGEEQRPMVKCPHCQTNCIVDIREFNKDMTRLARYTCHSCYQHFYAGLLLLAAGRLESLLEHLQRIIAAADPKGLIELGKDK